MNIMGMLAYLRISVAVAALPLWGQTIQDFACSPAPLATPGAGSCTVTLSAPPAANAGVTLTTNIKQMTIPAPVEIAAGERSASFAVTSEAVPFNTTASMVARLGNSQKAYAWRLTSPPEISALTCRPTSVVRHQTSKCTAALTNPAPAGGMALALFSNHASLQVPETVVVPEGATSVEFPVAAGEVTSVQFATVTARGAAADRRVGLSIFPNWLGWFGCSPDKAVSGQALSCSIGLTTLAPADDVWVQVESSSQLVSPANYYKVPAGESTISMVIPTAASDQAEEVTLVATHEGKSFRKSIRLKPAAAAKGQEAIAAYHPRILINRNLNLEQLKSVGRGALASDLTALHKLMEPGGFHLTQNNPCVMNEHVLLSSIMAAGYMYLTTDDARYADYLIDRFLRPCDAYGTYPFSTSTDDGAFGLMAASLAFDWAYARIVERDQTTDPGLKDRLVGRIKTAYNWLADPANFSFGIRESDFHNYTVAFEAAYLFAGLALHGEDEAAGEMIERGWGMIARGYEFSPTTFGDTFRYRLKSSIDFTDGAMNWEGPTYFRSTVPEILLAIEAMDTATERSGRLWETEFANVINAGYFMVYNFRPNQTTAGLGDSNAGTKLSWKDNFGLAILEGRFRDPYIRRLIDVNGGGWYGGYGTGLVYKLMYYDPSVPAASFDALPPSRQFGRDIVMRSGWGPEDTFLTFSAGFSGVFHNHLDDNSFTLFRYSDLAGDGGYSLSRDYYYNYFKRTVAHNAILVRNPDDCWRDNTPACTLSNDGGQRWTFRRFDPPYNRDLYGINRLWSATVLEDDFHKEQFLTAVKTFETKAAYDYVRSDATRAYSNQWSGQGGNTSARVALAQRELVFVRPEIVVILDRVRSTNAAFEKSWLLHSVQSPKPLAGGAWQDPAAGITGYRPDAVRVDNDRGRLFIKSLLPANANVKVIGGDGYQGWVDGANHWVPGLPATTPQWRIEVQPAEASASDLFLHVLFPTQQSVESMPAARLIEQGAWVGAEIPGSQTPCVVMFPRTEAVETSAAYSVTEAANALHVVTGLEKGSYQVTRDGVPVGGGPFQVESSGALSFTSPGQATFQVSRLEQ